MSKQSKHLIFFSLVLVYILANGCIQGDAVPEPKVISGKVVLSDEDKGLVGVSLSLGST